MLEKGIGCNLGMVTRALLGIFLIFAELLWAQRNSEVPKTRVENVRETLHGVDLVDPYRWLENQYSSETRGWIDAQNAYTSASLQKLPERAMLQSR